LAICVRVLLAEVASIPAENETFDS